MRDLPSHLLSDVLALPHERVPYELGRRLAALRPGRALLETDSSSFDLAHAIARGHTEGALVPAVHAQLQRRYFEDEDGLTTTVLNAAYACAFEGCRVEVVTVTHIEGDCASTRSYVIAPDEELAERFVIDVCRFVSEAAGEVLVFDNGAWRRDEGMFAAVRKAPLDELVLRGSLRDDLLADIRGFFARRDVYRRHRVPWRRGVLLYGPPGNGKTHFLKGLIASIDRPCLYVKSIAHRNEHETIRRIFTRARALAPSLLVLEDLETLIGDHNRSYFLNEMDGFSENDGVVVLATTNYPERIDPAIVDRPSRFDRKYLFDLPSPEERRVYLARWAEGLDEEARPTAAAIDRIAAATGGFSFAYLKELALSATLRHFELATGADDATPSMDAVLREVLDVLKEQSQRGKSPSASRGRRVGLVPEA